MSPATVAVIDIGSNSIKLLVASRDPAAPGRLLARYQRTEETRIGTGITGSPPRLSAEAMERAFQAVRSLLDDATRHQADTLRLVATSAVRDAANREAFMASIQAATGHPLAVLTGEEEARGIARGIACDPFLPDGSGFLLFDLGGGSLEMLEFAGGSLRQLASLQLGCVRVTERCLPDPSLPLTASQIETIRAIEAAASGKSLAESSPVLPVAALNALAMSLAALPLHQRRSVPGVPAARADVLPTALLTLVEIAGFARAAHFRHSFYNLRFGLAAQLLGL